MHLSSYTWTPRPGDKTLIMYTKGRKKPAEHLQQRSNIKQTHLFIVGLCQNRPQSMQVVINASLEIKVLNLKSPQKETTPTTTKIVKQDIHLLNSST